MQNQKDIVILIIVSTALIFLLAGLIVTILYLYQKKRMHFLKNLEELKLDYERNLLKIQLEIQEQTCQNISREIHDNIGLSLTLAKLNLNTIRANFEIESIVKIDSSIQLITKAINDLRDLSKNLNSELINNNGLIKVLEMEIDRINRVGVCSINMEVNGDPVFLNCFKELFIYRIAQEAFNNIMKHSKAKNAWLKLNYMSCSLTLIVKDDGIGFNPEKNYASSDQYTKSGLLNIQQRCKVIGGECSILGNINEGTSIIISIPINNQNE